MRKKREEMKKAEEMEGTGKMEGRNNIRSFGSAQPPPPDYAAYVPMWLN